MTGRESGEAAVDLSPSLLEPNVSSTTPPPSREAFTEPLSSLSGSVFSDFLEPLSLGGLFSAGRDEDGGLSGGLWEGHIVSTLPVWGGVTLFCPWAAYQTP